MTSTGDTATRDESIETPLPSFPHSPTAEPPRRGTDGTAAPSEGETSLLGRFVALFTPLFAVLAGLLAGWVAQTVPGVHLDEGHMTAFMITASTTALGSAWKWLQGWQQHELMVAHGLVQRRGKPATTSADSGTSTEPSRGTVPGSAAPARPERSTTRQ